MLITRTVASIVSIFLGLSAAVAQQPETAANNNNAAAASRALTNPPEFEGLMVDAKGKTVGRLVILTGTNLNSNFVVRQISGVWVELQVGSLTTGFQITNNNNDVAYFYQSVDCAGQAYFSTNFGTVTGLVTGVVAIIPPATAPSIYFPGLPLSVLTLNSFRAAGGAYGGACQVAQTPPVIPVGPAQSVPVSSLGLTLPFSVK